jgi:hypothetical protein
MTSAPPQFVDLLARKAHRLREGQAFVEFEKASSLLE